MTNEPGDTAYPSAADSATSSHPLRPAPDPPTHPPNTHTHTPPPPPHPPPGLLPGGPLY